MRTRAIATLALALLGVAACVGNTGGTDYDFTAAAAGPVDAQVPLVFTNSRGYDVSLTKATLHVGAVYLDQALPVSGAQDTSCILPGTYTVQEIAGLDVDLLSPTPQPFPILAHGATLPGTDGTPLPAIAGQVWLTHGDIATVEDNVPVLVLEGSVTLAGIATPFAASISIGSNRATADTALAGASPICKERIVSPIETQILVKSAGGLLVRIDPRHLFYNVDFSKFTALTNGTLTFSDDPTADDYTQPSINLYINLHATTDLYTFTWADTL